MAIQRRGRVGQTLEGAGHGIERGWARGVQVGGRRSNVRFGTRQRRTGCGPKHADALSTPDPVLGLDQLVPEPRHLARTGERARVVDEGQDVVSKLERQVVQEIALELWGNDVGEEGELGGRALVDEFCEQDPLGRRVELLEGVCDAGHGGEYRGWLFCNGVGR